MGILRFMHERTHLDDAKGSAKAVVLLLPHPGRRCSRLSFRHSSVVTAGKLHKIKELETRLLH
jgi:hypothetical protein